jgi:hypothetical protein
MSATERKSKRGSAWRDCLTIAAILFVLELLLFPSVGHGPGAAKRDQARNDVQQICNALKVHVTEYGSEPPGDHVQVMTALRGANPRYIVFFAAPANRFNARGEYLDPWGTPFHIDTSNPIYPWAYSFGKDTKDDGGDPESDDIPSWR